MAIGAFVHQLKSFVGRDVVHIGENTTQLLLNAVLTIKEFVKKADRPQRLDSSFYGNLQLASTIRHDDTQSARSQAVNQLARPDPVRNERLLVCMHFLVPVLYCSLNAYGNFHVEFN